MNLTEEDLALCQRVFADLDEDGIGTIRSSDLKIALERIGSFPNENDLFKMISELDDHNTGFIKFSDFLSVYYKIKYSNNDDNDVDTLDAFVAMGGNDDTSGKVDADKLINIIKNEFQMTIDIESLIKEIDKDGSGEIEYDEFKSLMSNNPLGADW